MSATVDARSTGCRVIPLSEHTREVPLDVQRLQDADRLAMAGTARLLRALDVLEAVERLSELDGYRMCWDDVDRVIALVCD